MPLVRLLCTITAFALCSAYPLWVTAQEQDQPVALRFAPPDGTNCRKTVKTVRTQYRGEKPTVVHEETTVEFTVSMRPARTGYLITTTTSSALRDGKPNTEMARELLVGVPLICSVSIGGRFDGASNTNKSLAFIRQLYSPPLEDGEVPDTAHEQELVFKLMNTMSDMWSRYVRDLAGHTRQLGERWYATHTSTYTLPSGRDVPVTFYDAYTIIGWETVRGVKVVRIRQDSDTTLNNLAERLRVSKTTIMQALQITRAPGSTVDVTECDELLIDPHTLLYYSERAVIRAVFSESKPGEMQVLETVETMVTAEYSYQ